VTGTYARLFIFFVRDTPTVVVTTDGFKTDNTFFTWIFGREVIYEHDSGQRLSNSPLLALK
jgi:hypothetical protein